MARRKQKVIPAGWYKGYSYAPQSEFAQKLEELHQKTVAKLDLTKKSDENHESSAVLSSDK